MRPDISSDNVSDAAGLAAFLQILDQAALEVEARGGWPTTSQPSRIDVVDGSGIATTWGTVNALGADKTFALDPLRSPTIRVGVHILTQGVGMTLAQQGGLAPVDALALLLAHETFHLAEADRMIGCRVASLDRLSSFAAGLNPQFSDAWQTAGRALAGNYPTRRGADADMAPAFSGLAWKAADLASELVADLLALHMLRDHPQRAAMLQSLLALRADEEAAAQAKIAASPHLVDPPYQIGAELAALAPLAAQPDDWPIWEQCWGRAVAAIQNEPGLATGTRDALASAVPLAPRPAKASFFNGFWKKR